MGSTGTWTVSGMRTLCELPDERRPRRSVRTAVGDAVGWILVIDGLLSLSGACTSIGEVFFHLPGWVPGRAVVPAAIGAGVLLRCRPAILAGVALAGWNTLQYGSLVASERIAGLPVCLSLLVALSLVPALRYRRRAHPAAVAAAAAGLLLGHLLTFGCTDYRRPAEAIVVFGARAHSPTQCTEVLADRTLTGVRLYRQGYAGKLVLSGGGFEPQAMRHLARRCGVPAEDILLDFAGTNTAATLANLRGRFGRVLAVSNYFHNARIKMAARRLGLACYTVPADMRRHLPGEPYWVARECAAFAAYYLHLR